MRIFSRMHFQIKMLNLLEKFIAVHVFLTKIDPNICKALKFKKDKPVFEVQRRSHVLGTPSCLSTLVFVGEIQRLERSNTSD